MEETDIIKNLLWSWADY